MEQIAKAVAAISLASGRLEKEALLRRHASTPGFKEVMQFIYNPYVKTGIAAAKLAKYGMDANSAISLSYEDAIKHFMAHQTGSEADVRFARAFINGQSSIGAQQLAEAMVSKNLKIGVTETTLNNVYGNDFIPKIGLMLAHKYPQYRHAVKGPFIVTEKLDGHRRILVKECGTINLYTRTGILDEGLLDVEQEAAYLPDNMVYDGEFLAIGEFSDSIKLRIATSAIMSRKGVRRGVTFNIFDAIPVDEFKRGRSTNTAIARKLLVGSMFGDSSIQHLDANYSRFIKACFIGYDFNFIKPVPILGIARTEDDVLNFAAPIWKRGYEGVMLNTFHGAYEIKRTKEMLKVKKVEEIVLPIIGMLEGTGKFSGSLGALLVDYKGNQVGVGSGFDDYQRQEYWRAGDAMMGKMVEIDTFGESQDKDGKLSLNCPIFKALVGGAE